MTDITKPSSFYGISASVKEVAGTPMLRIDTIKQDTENGKLEHSETVRESSLSLHKEIPNNDSVTFIANEILKIITQVAALQIHQSKRAGIDYNIPVFIQGLNSTISDYYIKNKLAAIINKEQKSIRTPVELLNQGNSDAPKLRDAPHITHLNITSEFAKLIERIKSNFRDASKAIAA